MSRKDVELMLMNNVPNINNKEIYIFGAGITASLYYNGLQRLKELKISGYIDNDLKKQGRVCNGKNVVSLNSLIEKKDRICVLICSFSIKFIRSIAKQLSDWGFEYYHIDEIIFKYNRKRVLDAYDLFTDKKSRKIYEILLQERMFNTGNNLPVDSKEQYFALDKFNFVDQNEVFIDCGAYVGDTTERYIWNRDGVFKKIIALEPDQKNYTAMCFRINRLRKEWGLKENTIEIWQKGVADCSIKGSIISCEANNGLSSNIIENEKMGDIVAISLDEFVQEPYSFLKADVEGWEYKMLQGAMAGIKANKPMLAICIYHNAVDFYEVPLLVHQLVPEYKLSVRHHSQTISETVLYAWLD